MPKREGKNPQGEERYTIVHRLDNGETVTAHKREEPEWYDWDRTKKWLAMIIESRATDPDPDGYTDGLMLFGSRSVLGDYMTYTIVDDWMVSEEKWSPKAHDSMRVKLGWYDRDHTSGSCFHCSLKDQS